MLSPAGFNMNPPKQKPQNLSSSARTADNPPKIDGLARDAGTGDGRGSFLENRGQSGSRESEESEPRDATRPANGPQPGWGDTDIASAAVDVAKTAAAAVSAQASEIASNVADEVSLAVDAQKTRGAETMRGFAKAIHTAANELTEQSPAIARGFHSAAEKVEGLSGRLTNKSVGDLMHETTALARQQPGVFFAGAVVAGFALARFFKSSPAGATSDKGDASIRVSSQDSQKGGSL
jgi:hypothetical protein